MAVSQEIQEKMLKEAYSATPNYDIDYNDKRFTDVTDAKNDALDRLDETYAGMIGDTDRYFNDQIEALEKWEDKQTQLQNEQTDFAIQQINQQKDQAHKDYLKEQSASYVDWQKQSNKYGTAAEQMASAGLTNTGFSESSQVSMYNTYQNRVAMARESYNNAVLNYNNSIKEAQLANNAALAEIAYQTLQKSLELSLQGFQYKNQLILEQANKRIELDNMYYNRYQDVLQQINTENAIKEDIRQYNETMAWNTEQKELDRQFEEKQAEATRAYQTKQAELDRQFKAQQAELERKHDKEMLAAETKAAKEKLEQQHKLEMQQLAKEQEYKMAQLNKQLANEEALLEKQYELANKPLGNIEGDSPKETKSSGPSVLGGLGRNDTEVSWEVNTAYYQGARNPDASKYGTFSNGYQPKGISGYGEVTKTGDTITFSTQTLYGQKQTVTQNVWKTPDGSRWYWQGRENEYKRINGRGGKF